MSLARIRTGDTVVVISGKEKGKTGRVMAVDLAAERVLIEGVNIVKRHVKPNVRDREGGIRESERPLHASKVMPVDPETGKGTRVRTQVEADGSKNRVAVKSGKALATEAS